MTYEQWKRQGLVKLKLTSGDDIYLNPDMVVAATAPKQSGIAMLGTTALTIIPGGTILVNGDPDMVNRKLRGEILTEEL